jgi:hypothetical protein
MIISEFLKRAFRHGIGTAMQGGIVFQYNILEPLTAAWAAGYFVARPTQIEEPSGNPARHGL